MNLRNLAPFLDWPRITGKSFRADLIAGLTVALVAIPQSLAYAQLAGVPAYFGLYAAFIPTIIGALFGSSRQLSTGPVAMTSLLTAASVAQLAPHGSELFYSYVILLALLSGIFQIAFGVMRMGVMLNFLSQPVLMGFINAAAIIIGLSQLPAMLGIPSKQSAHFLVDIWHVIIHLNEVHGLSLVFGLTALLMLIGFKRYASKLPGVLITVTLLTVISYLVGYAGMGGRVVGEIPQGLPSFSVPPFDWHASTELLPAAFVIALISFMEAMSSSKVIAIKTRVAWDENQELIGQGLAKVAAAFSHSMPVSGSFSRSALNLSAEAMTGLSSLFSASFVVLTLLFFTPLLYHLPKPVLSAIIMMAVGGLVNFNVIRKAWKAGRDDGMAAVITFVATLLFAPDIQDGILTGIMLSLALLLYRMMKPRIALLGMHHDGGLRDLQRLGLPQLHQRLSALRFDGALRFVNVSYFEDAILKLERDNPELKYILIAGGGINAIDASGIDMLSNLITRFKGNGIAIVFSGLKHQVLEIMTATGLTDQIGAANLFISDHDALNSIMPRLERTAQASAAVA
jgi:SulP family sulfate permease